MAIKKIEEDKDSKGRAFLAEKYRENILETKMHEEVKKIIDKGEKKTLEYYLGAEEIALTGAKLFMKLNIPPGSDVGQLWNTMLGYISYKIIELQG